MEYFKRCNINYIESGQAEENFYKEMEDGYIIIYHNDGENIEYFIDNDKIDNIYRELINYQDIITILKEKLNG